MKKTATEAANELEQQASLWSSVPLRERLHLSTLGARRLSPRCRLNNARKGLCFHRFFRHEIVQIGGPQPRLANRAFPRRRCSFDGDRRGRGRRQALPREDGISDDAEHLQHPFLFPAADASLKYFRYQHAASVISAGIGSGVSRFVNSSNPWTRKHDGLLGPGYSESVPGLGTIRVPGRAERLS